MAALRCNLVQWGTGLLRVRYAENKCIPICHQCGADAEFVLSMGMTPALAHKRPDTMEAKRAHRPTAKVHKPKRPAHV